MNVERQAAHVIYCELVDTMRSAGDVGIFMTVRGGDTDTGISVKLSHLHEMPAVLRALADEIESHHKGEPHD
jgi:hypothetical protein